MSSFEGRPIPDLLREWFDAGVESLAPTECTLAALTASPAPASAPLVIAIGKAAIGMSRAAVDWLAEMGLEPFGGLVVSDQPGVSPHPAIELVAGDHPVPGLSSQMAAERLDRVIAQSPPDTPVEVFISGGTSSMIASPISGISPAEMQTAFELFHRMGLPIQAMNALRRRLTRFSGGRLATALGPRAARAWLISDVADNDLATIGSGPLESESIDPNVVPHLLRRPDLSHGLPPTVLEALAVTPAPLARRIPHRLVADRHTAMAGAATAAEASGAVVTINSSAIVGDAEEAGKETAQWLWDRSRQKGSLDLGRSGIMVDPAPPRLIVNIWSGETTVALPLGHGLGGRCMQFCLSAAGEMHRINGQLEGGQVNQSLFAAGTDGKDGPTDAAGALVDGGTWGAMIASGLDPEAALAECDAYRLFDRFGALVRTGPTGTNVGDLFISAVWG